MPVNYDTPKMESLIEFWKPIKIWIPETMALSKEWVLVPGASLWEFVEELSFTFLYVWVYPNGSTGTPCSVEKISENSLTHEIITNHYRETFTPSQAIEIFKEGQQLSAEDDEIELAVEQPAVDPWYVMRNQTCYFCGVRSCFHLKK